MHAYTVASSLALRLKDEISSPVIVTMESAAEKDRAQRREALTKQAVF